MYPSSDAGYEGTAIDASYAIMLTRTFLIGGIDNPHTSILQGLQGHTVADAPPHAAPHAPPHAPCAMLSPSSSAPIMTREEAGCVLWDLAGSEAAAEMLVEAYRLVEVVGAVLARRRSQLLLLLLLPHTFRWRFRPRSLLPHIPCLSHPGLLPSQGKEVWMHHLSRRTILEHLIFVARNVLDPLCLERCLDAVVALMTVAEAPQGTSEVGAPQGTSEAGAPQGTSEEGAPQGTLEVGAP